MMRYLSSTSKSASGSTPVGFNLSDDKASTFTGEDDATIAESVGPLPPPILTYKRLDFYFSRWTRSWTYKNMGAKVLPDPKSLASLGNVQLGKFRQRSGADDPWKDYAFVVIRSLPREEDMNKTVSYSIHIKSPYLLHACKDVIQYIPGISWDSDSVQVNPYLLLACLSGFETYRDELKSKSPKQRTEEESHILSSINVLINYLRSEYESALSTIEHLTTRGEITHDLLMALLVPRSILVGRCPLTREPQAMQLISVTKNDGIFGANYVLQCVYIARVDPPQVAVEAAGYERIERTFSILEFAGTAKIESLDVYPIQFHPRAEELMTRLIARGRKYVGLNGIHHKHYKGTGSFKEGEKEVRYEINSRIMIDRVNFKRINSMYYFPVPWKNPSEILSSFPKSQTATFTDEELMIMSPIVQGFSLDDKMWLEFSVEHISDIQWDDACFENLVLPNDRKTLLRSLVEAHQQGVGVDDFVRGKGRGLVINLFCPPGTGKTLSAEATSEHVRKPLYAVGLGDLGIETQNLERKLTQVFQVAQAWKAIVLIDEADVFLQQRNMQDLQRNAMVAVFLRQLEYYTGILFLTTNRVKAYDDAFLSRIHVALRFHPLSASARRQVWTAFLAKAARESLAAAAAAVEETSTLSSTGSEAALAITDAELAVLSGKNVNGREIKNAVRTAQSLAMSRGESVGYVHLVEVLDVMEQFGEEFEVVVRGD